jgi:chromosome segregation ATPase
MSLLSAINEAQTAANHAKPFMKLMDALGNLDREIRAANSLQTDAQAAADLKAKLESEVPALKSEHETLTKAVGELQAHLKDMQAKADQQIADQQKAADDEIKRNQAAISADFDKKIADKKAEIVALQVSFDHLSETKADIQAQIDALKESFKTAHAALA